MFGRCEAAESIPSSVPTIATDLVSFLSRIMAVSGGDRISPPPYLTIRALLRRLGSAEIALCAPVRCLYPIYSLGAVGFSMLSPITALSR